MARLDGTSYGDACIAAVDQTTTKYSCVAEADTGVNYLRVMETDINGKNVYSQVDTLDNPVHHTPPTTPPTTAPTTPPTSPPGTPQGLSLYPNPVKDVLNVDGLANYKIIQIADISRQVLLRQNVVSQK